MIVRTEADLRQAMQLDSETEHVEFKEAKANFHFEELADYCCALANEGGGTRGRGASSARKRSVPWTGPRSAYSSGCAGGSMWPRS
jgi:ATP-dependent DNA helicase RecG